MQKAIFYALVVGSLLGASLHANPIATSLEAKLVASAPASDAARFGGAVAIDGDTSVIGAHDDDTLGVDAGAAYVFVRSGSGWMMQAKLLASDGATSDIFGTAVAVDGDTAVVAAAFHNGLRGAAYVFVRSGSTWTEQAKLTASDSAADDRFGGAVSVHGDTVIVGAFLDDNIRGTDAGAAYVFVRTGTSWTEQAKLMASDGSTNDIFGHKVDLDGDTALVTASVDDTVGGVDAGSAYVFVRNGSVWSQQTQLLASDAASSDRFGVSGALSGNTIVIGADFDDTAAGVNAGSAYVFTRSGTLWSLQTQLLPGDGAADDSFGAFLDVDGDTVLVSAWGHDLGPMSFAGAVYAFSRTGATWTQQDKLIADDAAAGDGFATSVAVQGNTALLGVRDDDTAVGADSGSTYAFTRSGSDWNLTAFLTASRGTAADFFGSAVDVDGDTAVVGAWLDDTPGGTNGGSASVFVRNGGAWRMQAQLMPSDGAAGDLFGRSVALSGDTIVVGAYQNDNAGGTNAGAAYVFVRSGTNWTQQTKLVASDGAANDEFGLSVDVSGNTVLVGSRGHDDTAARPNAGAAYVFVRNGTLWGLEDQLLADDAASGDMFGHAVALEANTALVGAFADDTAAGFDAGSAYVFARSGTNWSQQAHLFAGDGEAPDNFGNAVGLSGDTALVGANTDDTAAGTDAGSAYVFVRSGSSWSEQAQLQAPDGGFESFFGSSVAVSGDIALIGMAFQDSGPLIDVGSAYLFSRNGSSWTLEVPLLAPDGEFIDQFGIAVALDGDTMMVGSWGDDNAGLNEAGSAYVLRLIGPLRGDANMDSDYSVSDIFFLLSHLFGGGPVPGTSCSGDADNDLIITIRDPFFLINYLFASGPAPTPPSCL